MDTYSNSNTDIGNWLLPYKIDTSGYYKTSTWSPELIMETRLQMDTGSTQIDHLTTNLVHAYFGIELSASAHV